ncbi:MAG: acyl carrier protein [Acidobacteria bacterium]|nr:MAG: acyl carrier protein [Acidobacteriota bacterium]
MRDQIRRQLKETIVRALRIDDTTPDQLRDDHQLIGGDFDVDSIDMLQLVLEIEKTFGIKLVSGQFDRAEWATIDTLAEAVEKKLVAKGGAALG